MLLAGIQKNSFIDYPGKISCVLFLKGCNFDCPYCHNPSAVKLEQQCNECYKNQNAVIEFLNERKKILDGVVISGGEPTLQNDIFDLCKKIKNIGYPVKIDTNGSRPDVIKRLIQKDLVDYLAMDIKTDPLQYAPLIQQNSNPKDILTSINLIMNSGLPYEFKTTCVKPLLNSDIIENICILIQGAKLYALQQFHNTQVLNPKFFQRKNRIYSDRELMRFKAIADPHVERCMVRL